METYHGVGFLNWNESRATRAQHAGYLAMLELAGFDMEKAN